MLLSQPDRSSQGQLLLWEAEPHPPYDQLAMSYRRSPSPPSSSPYLLLSILHDEEGVGPIGHGESEAILQRAAAIVSVADAVLVDVVHREGGGWVVTLPVAGAFDPAVPRGMHNCERY